MKFRSGLKKAGKSQRTSWLQTLGLKNKRCWAFEPPLSSPQSALVRVIHEVCSRCRPGKINKNISLFPKGELLRTHQVAHNSSASLTHKQAERAF